MKLLVEAGSTKTDSVILHNGVTIGPIIQSSGINPVTDSTHLDAVQELTAHYQSHKIEEVYYYGSGCINDDVNNKLAQNIMQHLGYDPIVEINDDLIALGRGFCGYEKGIVIILGTGSNIGFYDGVKISEGLKSCGYLIGDEGSGYKIGQAIVRAYCRGHLSEGLMDSINQTYAVSPDTLIPEIYKQANPRPFIASFGSILKKVEEPLKNKIMDEVFDPLLDRLIVPMYQRYKAPIHLSGSIAFHFSSELREKFRKFNIIASSFEPSPLKGLIRYHTNGKGS